MGAFLQSSFSPHAGVQGGGGDPSNLRFARGGVIFFLSEKISFTPFHISVSRIFFGFFLVLCKRVSPAKIGCPLRSFAFAFFMAFEGFGKIEDFSHEINCSSCHG